MNGLIVAGVASIAGIAGVWGLTAATSHDAASTPPPATSQPASTATQDVLAARLATLRRAERAAEAALARRGPAPVAQPAAPVRVPVTVSPSGSGAAASAGERYADDDHSGDDREAERDRGEDD